MGGHTSWVYTPQPGEGFSAYWHPCVSGLCYCITLLLLGFGIASIPVVFALTTNVSHHGQIYLSTSSTLGLIVALRRLGNCQHQISLLTSPRCTGNWGSLPLLSQPPQSQLSGNMLVMDIQRRPMFSTAASYNQGLRICSPWDLLRFLYCVLFLCVCSHRVSGAVLLDLVWEGQRQQLQATLHSHSIISEPQSLTKEGVSAIFRAVLYSFHPTSHCETPGLEFKELLVPETQSLTFQYTWLHPSQNVSFHLSCKARVLSNSLDRGEQWNTYDLSVHTLTDCPCISLPYCLKNST